jgi:hypothetical protein
MNMVDLLLYVRKWTATIAEEEKDRLTPVSYLILPWDLSFFMFWKRSLRLLSSCRLSGNHQKCCGMHFPLLEGRNYLLMNVILIMGQIVEALSARYLGPDYSQVHHIPHPLICNNASWWKAGNLLWLKVKSFCMWRFGRLWDALAIYVKLRWGVCN